MTRSKHFLNRIPNSNILFFMIIIFLTKIIIFILVKANIFNIGLGGGSDADYYNSYVQGYSEVAVNIWPIILKFLNNLNFYSREIISYIFLALNLFLIPFIVANLSGVKVYSEQKYYLYIVLLCLIYPTLYFYTFDIYRDVFMVFSFLIGCLVVKSCLRSTSILKFAFLFLIALLIGWFLAALRPYLGVAFISSLFLWNIKFTKKRIIFLSILYLIALFFANYIGIFDSVTEYRAGFEESEGGSTLGLNFSNPTMFIPNFIISALGQLFGLFITNALAIVIFIVETIPFFFMLMYVFKNIRYADKFLRFLIIFFVIYASIWLIGNDNLGTAVRLRIYNYLAIYICFFYILRLKTLMLSESERVVT